MEEIRNGVNGWELIEYEWNATTGVAKFNYTRKIVSEEETKTEARSLTRCQPCGPQHVGWR